MSAELLSSTGVLTEDRRPYARQTEALTAMSEQTVGQRASASPSSRPQPPWSALLGTALLQPEKRPEKRLNTKAVKPAIAQLGPQLPSPQLPSPQLPSPQLPSPHLLVLAHERLVAELANLYARPNVPREDLVGEGRLALLEAASRFDSGSDLLFSEFAASWVNQAMVRYIACNSHAVSEGYYVAAEDGDDDGFLALADQGVDMDEEAADCDDARIDTDDEDGIDPPDGSPDPEQRFAAVEASHVDANSHQVVMALHALSGRERYVVRRRYLTRDPAPLEALGYTMHLPVAMVRKLEAQAVAKLRHAVIDSDESLQT